MRLFITIFLLGQILMATTINYIEVKGIKIPLIFKQEKRLSIVSMQLVFKTSGSVVDKTPGLSKLSAKMMNEGTKKLGSVGFAQKLDAKAIHMSFHTGVETFVMELGCLKEEFNSATILISEVLKEPNLTQSTLMKVKTEMIGQLSAKESDYDYVASNLLKSILFKNTPLAYPTNGTVKSIESVNLKEIQEFLNQHLTLSNLIIVMGGDISLKEAKQKAKILAQDSSVGVSNKLAYYKVINKPTEVILNRPATKQAYMYFGSPYNLLYNSKDYYKAKVATFILGAGGFGSRLMDNVRVKKGLAYSAYASLHVSRSSSYLSGYLQTKITSLKEAQSIVKATFAKFVKDGVTKKELDQTKRFLLGSEPLRVETLSQKLSRAFMQYYKDQSQDYSQKELKMISELTLSELNSFIKQHKEILELSYAIVTK